MPVQITTMRSRGVGAWRVAAGQPGWVLRAALTALLAVLVLPILILVGLAVLAAIVVFTVLALANALVNRVRRLLGGDREGRQNVRVIVRNPAGQRRWE